MQPYFFPYIGYFQLINATETFVIYDNIQYIKGGWINKNRLLFNNKIQTFTVPLKKSSSFSEIKSRRVLSNVHGQKIIAKILRLINGNYCNSRYFSDVYPIIVGCFSFDSKNLFDYIYNSINVIINYLDIKTNLIISSELSINHDSKHQDKVIEICKNLKADQYINSIGGYDIYSMTKFSSKNINLKFLKVGDIDYKKETIKGLSIIDLLMNYSKIEINNMLDNYELV